MGARALVVLSLFALSSCREARAGGRKQVVTATLTACAAAFADPASGKAGGGETNPMTLTCTVTRAGKKWECITAYPGEEEKSQHWVLTSGKKPCDVTSDATACNLRNDGGNLWVRLGASQGVGIATLRLDLDTSAVSGGAMGVRVCSGMLSAGSQ